MDVDVGDEDVEWLASDMSLQVVDNKFSDSRTGTGICQQVGKEKQCCHPSKAIKSCLICCWIDRCGLERGQCFMQLLAYSCIWIIFMFAFI